jgi:hypothetical protein
MGIIHMNGRLFDPLIGRFMSADPFIQAPYNLKSFNRYSYVWNNPMVMFDPDGFNARHDSVTPGGYGSSNGDHDPKGVGSISDGRGGQIGGNWGDSVSNSSQLPSDMRPDWNSGTFTNGAIPTSPSQFSVPATDKRRTGWGLLDSLLDVVDWWDQNVATPIIGAVPFAGVIAKAPVAVAVAAGVKTAVAAKKGVDVVEETKTVIGRVKDLKDLQPHEKSLLDRLPNLGNPKANWAQNSGILRQEMERGLPIRDASPMDTAGQFLNAERNLLVDRGWTFDRLTNFWNPP